MWQPDIIRADAEQQNPKLEKTLQAINGILENDIKDIDEIFNKQFLDQINHETADQILKSIPNDLKSDPEVQNVIRVFQTRLNVSGNNQFNYQEATLAPISPELDDWNNIINLSSYKKDIKKIKETISQYLTYIQWSTNLANLKNNLEMINKILNSDKAKLKDLRKIDQFLSNNGITDLNWDQTNIWPLLAWTTKFLNNIKQSMENHQNGNRVINTNRERIDRTNAELQETLKERARCFINLFNKVPNDLWNLSEFSDKDIKNITDYINESKYSNYNELRAQIFLVYYRMRQHKQLVDTNGKDANGNTIKSKDKENFYKIFNCIEDNYIKEWAPGAEQLQDYELDLFFKNINKTNLQNLFANSNPVWNGENLEDNKYDNYITNNLCKWYHFTTEKFKERFNLINKDRKESNKQALNQTINIKALTSNLLNKITLTEEWEWDQKTEKLTFKKDDNTEPIELKADNFIKTQELTINTNWINFLWNELNEAITELQEGRFKQLIDAKKNATPTNNPEVTTDDLKEILKSDIKTTLFDGLSRETIAKAFNQALTDENKNDNEKKIILWLTRQWLTNDRKNDPNNDSYKKIHELQEKLGCQPIDWKFGNGTFRAFKKLLGIVEEPVRPKNKVKPERPVKINWGELSEVTVINSPDERITHLGEKLELELRPLNEKQQNFFGIKGNIQTYIKKDDKSWIYYYDNNQILHFTPNLERATAYYNSSEKAKSLPCCTQKYNVDTQKRENEEPPYCNNFLYYIHNQKESLAKDLWESSTIWKYIKSCNIKYDTNKKRFYIEPTTSGHRSMYLRSKILWLDYPTNNFRKNLLTCITSLYWINNKRTINFKQLENNGAISNKIWYQKEGSNKLHELYTMPRSTTDKERDNMQHWYENTLLQYNK